MRLEELYPERTECREKLPQRFWSKVLVGGEDECWLWLASVSGATCYNGRHSPGGYGRFGLGTTRSPKATGAHRVSYMLHHGEVPDDMCVMHLCDNPPCVNPNHLKLGTKQENNLDRDLKKRTRGVSRAGSQNPRARLTEEVVSECRLRFGRGEKVAPMAREAGVSEAAMRFAVTGATWRDVAMPEAASRRLEAREVA